MGRAMSLQAEAELLEADGRWIEVEVEREPGRPTPGESFLLSI